MRESVPVARYSPVCNVLRQWKTSLILTYRVYRLYDSFEEEIINILPPELTLKKTTESNSRISYLDISISICNNKYVTEVYDKRENLNFNIVNYPYMCSNIPAKPTYGVYVSQLIRISRICDNYVSFVKIHPLLTKRLIKQGFW